MTFSGLGAKAGALLKARGKETIAVSESSTGGLISAALLSVPGASAYFVGGGVITRGRRGARCCKSPTRRCAACAAPASRTRCSRRAPSVSAAARFGASARPAPPARHRPGVAVQDRTPGGLGPCPAAGRDRRPPCRARGMGEPRGIVAGLLHFAGPSGRLRQHRVSPLAAQCRLLGHEPPAVGRTELDLDLDFDVAIDQPQRLAAPIQDHPRQISTATFFLMETGLSLGRTASRSRVGIASLLETLASCCLTSYHSRIPGWVKRLAVHGTPSPSTSRRSRRDRSISSERETCGWSEKRIQTARIRHYRVSSRQTVSNKLKGWTTSNRTRL